MTTLTEALTAQVTRADDRPNDPDHAFASEAGRCARQVGYRLRGTPRTEPETLTGLLALHLGNALHGTIQAALASIYPDFQAEVSWKQDALSGRADGIYTAQGGVRVVCEIKSMHPMAFKYAKEPKAEHLLQGALSAEALGAEYVHVIYLSKAAASGEECLAEWVQRAPLFKASVEALRLTEIVQQVIDGILPERLFEDDLIEHPATTKWPCQYCNWRAKCIEDGA